MKQIKPEVKATYVFVYQKDKDKSLDNIFNFIFEKAVKEIKKKRLDNKSDVSYINNKLNLNEGKL